MTLIESLVFIGTGFAVVVVALAALWILSAMVGRVFAGARAAASPAVAAPDVAPGIPPMHLAAIVAAVSASTGGRGRVLRVRAPAHLSGAWASEGRADQLASHRVRWDWALPGPPHVEAGAPPGEDRRTR